MPSDWYNTSTITTVDTGTSAASNLRWAVDTGTAVAAGTDITWTTNVTLTYDTAYYNARPAAAIPVPAAPAAMPPVAARRLKPSKEEKRAEILLLENLSEKQREEYKRLKSFQVIVKDKIYRIKRGRVGNIELIDDKGIAARYCVHPSVACPDEDTMLAQKLMLENDEKELLKLANVHFQRVAA